MGLIDNLSWRHMCRDPSILIEAEAVGMDGNTQGECVE